MASWLVILLVVIASAGSVVGFHFLSRRHILSAMEQKGLHLICGECNRLVARYQQGKDAIIRCENCLRAAERRLKRGD